MNFELLRPFSLTAARDGHPMVINGMNPQTHLPCIIPCVLVAEGGSNMEHCVRLTMERGRLCLAFADQLRMAPLGWLEGRPVYLGDALYFNASAPSDWVAKEWRPTSIDDGVVYQNDECVPLAHLTWTKPVRYPARKVWVNVYPEHYSHASISQTQYSKKSEADSWAHPNRLACIEIELPEIA